MEKTGFTTLGSPSTTLRTEDFLIAWVRGPCRYYLGYFRREGFRIFSPSFVGKTGNALIWVIRRHHFREMCSLDKKKWKIQALGSPNTTLRTEGFLIAWMRDPCRYYFGYFRRGLFVFSARHLWGKLGTRSWGDIVATNLRHRCFERYFPRIFYRGQIYALDFVARAR